MKAGLIPVSNEWESPSSVHLPSFIKNRKSLSSQISSGHSSKLISREQLSSSRSFSSDFQSETCRLMGMGLYFNSECSAF